MQLPATQIASTSRAQPRAGETEFMRMRRFTHRVEDLKMRPHDTVTSYAERFHTEVTTNPFVALQDQDMCFMLWRGLLPGLQHRMFPRWEDTYTFDQFVAELTHLEELMALEREGRERRDYECLVEFDRRYREYRRHHGAIEAPSGRSGRASPASSQQGRDWNPRDASDDNEEEDPTEILDEDDDE